MFRKKAAFAAAIFAAIITLAGFWVAADAQPKNESYRFEAVSEKIPVGENVRVEIRLIGPDGKPADAKTIIIKTTRLDMGPDGMAMMAAKLRPMPSNIPSVLAFETDIVMAGRWAFTVEARLSGHSEPVKGSIILTAVEKFSDATPTPDSEERKIKYYRNPMGLADISKTPKNDSMGMAYIPVYEDELVGSAGGINISLDKVQRAGVRTATVERRMLTRHVRGAGVITADESRLTMITAKFSGFVEELNVRTTGETINSGERLMTAWLESGELINLMTDLSALAGDIQFVARAKNNLRLFNVPESDIEAIAKGGAPKRTITFDAPVSGTVLDKPAVDGMRFKTGDMLFRIADLSQVWVIVEIAEQDLALVQPGQEVRLKLPSMPGEPITGEVDFIYPELNMETRSGRVRIVVPNLDRRLQLGLFTHAQIETPIGNVPVMAVPASAVMDDGSRQRVFIAKGGGRFEPREIVLGAKAGDFFEVRQGLSEGEIVVASGTFLIDAESNLQAALAAFEVESGAQ